MCKEWQTTLVSKPKKRAYLGPSDGRPGYNTSLLAPSAEGDGGEGDIVNKQNSNYFSPLTSKEEEKTLIVNVIQKVKNKSDELDQ